VDDRCCCRAWSLQPESRRRRSPHCEARPRQRRQSGCGLVGRCGPCGRSSTGASIAGRRRRALLRPHRAVARGRHPRHCRTAESFRVAVTSTALPMAMRL
jgi:hypothetical protein